MRKIISILIALGLVLGLGIMSVPTAAQPACGATVATADQTICAGTADTFTITFPTPVTLLPGNDRVVVEFGNGTTFGTWAAGDITVQGVNANVTLVERVGTRVSILIPPAVTPNPITPTTTVTVVIAKVTNPATPGTYTMRIGYKLVCCDIVLFCSATYTVAPATSTYGFSWDSSPTYPGIAVGFVPPFKACGQNITGGSYEFETGKFANFFDLVLAPTLIGCAGPCGTNVTVTLNLTRTVTGSRVSLGLNNLTGITHNLSLGTPITVGSYNLTANTTIIWDNMIHFSDVGDYTICVRAVCPAGTPVCPDCIAVERTVASACFDFKVYQDLDAGKIVLDEKWNLVSLPVVPLSTKITDLLLSLDREATDGDTTAELLAIWGYNCTAKAFRSYPPATGLSDMHPNFSYWVRLTYPITPTPAYNWWIFGTAKNMPPAMPLAYDLCVGWNNFGFTSLTTKDVGGAGNYLWNFSGAGIPLVYGWQNTGDWLTSGWQLIEWPTGDLVSGQGYWGYFPLGGQIVP